MDDISVLNEKQYHLKDLIRKRTRNIRYNFHDPEISHMEAVLSRGDRRLGKVIHTAWKLGA